jgi:hypothetical protein
VSNSLYSQALIPIEIQQQLKNCGLDLTAVMSHRENVGLHLAASSPRYFPIIDTCRLENGGVCVLPTKRVSPQERKSIVAFVPAAGASSRYLEPMMPLIDALNSRDASVCRQELERVRIAGFLNCPLPSSIKDLISALGTSSTSIEDALAERVTAELKAPKALYPAIVDGTTFLAVKRSEHVAMERLAGEVYICPPTYVTKYLSHLAHEQSSFRTCVYEQDASLATTRFDSQGNVALDNEGKVSLVPSGHGALLQLLPQIAEDFKGARGVFIRNIDNIGGISHPATEASQLFLDAFSWTLGRMDEMRQAIADDNIQNCIITAGKILKFWEISSKNSDSDLETLFTTFFHATPESIEKNLKSLLLRPLVIMGQVPNTAKDVGGTCVFTTVDGVPQKLCLEVPHASPTCRIKFLENSAKATHFNPVFVAAEIPATEGLRAWNNHPFWLISKKSWRGRDTYYQESILYEMLGSSQHCNVVFVEVPRLVFNPHKTLKDASQKTRADWSL